MKAEVEALIVEALRYRSQLEYVKSLSCLENAINLHPDQVYPRIHYALTFRELGAHEKAMREIEIAVQIAPLDFNALCEAGRTARDYGNYNLSLEYFTRAELIEGVDKKTIFNEKFHVFLALGRFYEAENLALGAYHSNELHARSQLAECCWRASKSAQTKELIQSKPLPAEVKYILERMQRLIVPKNIDKEVPMNQVYRVQETLNMNSAVRTSFENFKSLGLASNLKKNDDEPIWWGRPYDYAIIENSGIDFQDKRIADLGARDGFLGAYFSKDASEVHVSDYFEEWNDEWHSLGLSQQTSRMKDWETKWTKMAQRPERLIFSKQDITELNYPNNFFDITLCTSVIEHVWPMDVKAMSEIVRVTKPGGFIAISTEMSLLNRFHRGNFWYDEVSLFSRLIAPFDVVIEGNFSFSLDCKTNDSERYELIDGKLNKFVSCIFILRKIDIKVA
jgi:tetratricopeptide (TPR) repeat protein